MRATLLVVLVALLPGLAAAQTPAAPPRFLFGLNAGPGDRSDQGELPSSIIPPGAKQPGFHGVSTTLGMEGGIFVLPRVAVTTFFDQTFGASSEPGHWGTSEWHGTVRGWLTRRVWAEAGGGRYATSEFDGLRVRRITFQIGLLGRQ